MHASPAHVCCQLGSGEEALYRECKALAKQRAQWYYETTGPGSGLPVLTTLKDMTQSGDRVSKVSGVFYCVIRWGGLCVPDRSLVPLVQFWHCSRRRRGVDAARRFRRGNGGGQVAAATTSVNRGSVRSILAAPCS